jgi:multidrug resistance efflux pump
VPFRQIDIAAQVSGRIAYNADNCRTGRVVKLDEVLIRIDPQDYELEVTRLEEELEQADAMIRELQLEITTAENQIVLAKQQLEIDVRQLDRNMRLSTTSAVSQTELDTARRAELTTRNTMQSLQDNRNLLNQRLVRMDSGKALVAANLQKARLALERTEIRAPLEGIIVSENVEQDGYIQAGSTLITLQDSSQLDVACKLHMR